MTEKDTKSYHRLLAVQVRVRVGDAIATITENFVMTTETENFTMSDMTKARFGFLSNFIQQSGYEEKAIVGFAILGLMNMGLMSDEEFNHMPPEMQEDLPEAEPTE